MRLIFAVLLLVLAISCKDKDPGICGVEDPANDLPWLKARIEFKKTDGAEEFRRMTYIMRAEFEGNIVFFEGNCCPNCNTFVPFYDCNGNNLNIDYNKSYEQLKNQTLVWKHENSVCLFY